MKIVFHPEAYEEMIESVRFYEVRDDGLGLRFLEAVEDTMRRIRQFPNVGPVERADIRKRFVSGFSLPDSEGSNLHRSRNASAQKPGYWRKRLRS
jgi:hypothetical protein